MDWNEMEQEYVTGAVSYRELSKKHGIACSTIAQRGKEGHWVEKRQEYMAQRLEWKAEMQQQARRTGRLLEVADRLLDRVEELGAEDGVTASSLKTLSETLKNIRDAQMIKSSKDLQEQQARIEKLRKDLDRGEQESGAVTVRMEEKMGEFAA